MDEVSFSRDVLSAARAGRGPEPASLQHAAAGLGRGIAGLVNALDPNIVTVGGLARDLADIAGDRVHRAYRKGLMAADRSTSTDDRRRSLRGASTSARRRRARL